MSEFKHVVVCEASGPEGIYQRITFEQFYDTSPEQVSQQETLFTSVAMAVMDAAKKYRDEAAV